MIGYTFRRGQWENGTGLPGEDDWTDFSEYLESVGYESQVNFTLGTEGLSCAEIYRAKDGQSFYASVSPNGSDCYQVRIPDFPSLMMFLKDYGPAFSGIATSSWLEDLEELHEKVFRIYHGHESKGTCKDCKSSIEPS